LFYQRSISLGDIRYTSEAYLHDLHIYSTQIESEHVIDKPRDRCGQKS